MDEKYDRLRTPPSDALKTISGGRLNGKSDINPQWRIDIMNETFGPCGIGWQWELTEMGREDASGGEVFAHARVQVRVRISNDSWSEWVPGVGGNMLIASEKNGLHNNDEGYKMAVTDAIGNALKYLGVAAQVYRGLVGNGAGAERTKYGAPTQRAASQAPAAPTQAQQQGDAKVAVVEHAGKKTGASAKGPWSRFWAKIGGEYYSTFDTKIGDVILQSEGQTVKVFANANKAGNGYDIVSFEILGPTDIPNCDAPPQDDLPF